MSAVEAADTTVTIDSDSSNSDIECLGEFPAATKSSSRNLNGGRKARGKSSAVGSSSGSSCSSSRAIADSSEVKKATGVKRPWENGESDSALPSSSSSTPSPSTSATDQPFLSLDPTVCPASESKYQEIDLIIREFGLKDPKTGIKEDFTLFQAGNGLKQPAWKCQLSFNILPQRPPSAPRFSVELHSQQNDPIVVLSGLTVFPPIGVVLTLCRGLGLTKPGLNKMDLSAIWMDDLLLKKLQKEVSNRMIFTATPKLLRWLEAHALIYLSLAISETLQYVPLASTNPALTGPGFLRVPDIEAVMEAFQSANPRCDLKRLLKCPICGDEKEAGQGAVFFEECGHRFCRECVQLEMKSKIRRGLVGELRCLEEGCRTIPSSEMVSGLVDKDTFDRYCDRTADAFVSDNPLMVRCPQCRNPMELPTSIPLPVIVTCQCQLRFCSHCKAAPHPGATCSAPADARESLIVLSEAEKQETFDRFLNSQKSRRWTADLHEQSVILDGDYGFGLRQVLAPYVDQWVKTVEIDEPHLSTQALIGRFVEFCAMLMTQTCCLTTVLLTTSPDKNAAKRKRQEILLEEVRLGLELRSVQLTIKYSPHLHDRQIRLDNGWLIKIGRGLHYFKPFVKNDQLDSVDLHFPSLLRHHCRLYFQAFQTTVVLCVLVGFMF